MFVIKIAVLLTLSRFNDAQNVLPPKADTTVNNAEICASPRRCVPYYQCREDGTFNKFGVDIIVHRFNDDDTSTPQVETTTPMIPTPDATAQRVCTYLELCCAPSTSKKVKRQVSAGIRNDCGWSNPNGINDKTSDTDKAQYGEYPWMVAIIQTHSPNNKLDIVGGGSLIHPNVILTAAHIFGNKTASDFIVRAGEWNTETDSENLPHQERNIDQIIRHEKYSINGFLHDYALLFVQNSFNLGTNIKPICLPPTNYNVQRDQHCYSAGWGKEKLTNLAPRSTIMKKIRLSVIPYETCQEQLRKTQLGDIFELHESFTCASGVDGKDTCTGDGGSPLMCPIANQPNRYYQAGVVAWGLGCGRENVPGAYSNVGLAREWIDGQMDRLGFGTESYSV